MNQRIFKVKEQLAEVEVQNILLSQKITFEEERGMRKTIEEFKERSIEENKEISKLEKEVILLLNRSRQSIKRSSKKDRQAETFRNKVFVQA